MKTSSIKVFGKNVASVFCHFIMELNTSNLKGVCDRHIRMECITNNDEEIIGGPYSKSLAKKLIKKNKNKCDVFNFYNSEGRTIGTLSVMYRGGNDVEYKVRNVDAFIYNVYTLPEYRGNGYAGEMIDMLMEHLKHKGIYKIYLAVSTNNESAIKAYEKSGFRKVSKKSFFRVLKRNIPYRKV